MAMAPVTPPMTASPLPQSTPIKTDSATTLPFTTNQKYRIQSCTAMAGEMRKYLVGPMPPEQFLNDFFPLNELSVIDFPSFYPGCYSDTIIARSETSAYDPFVSVCAEFLCMLLISPNYFSRPKRRRNSCLGLQLSILPIPVIEILEWIFRSRSSLTYPSIVQTQARGQ
jgi:hypothetical protein